MSATELAPEARRKHAYAESTSRLLHEQRSTRQQRSAWIWRFGALSYLTLLGNLSAFLRMAHWQSALGSAYVLIIFLTYAAFYLLPVVGLLVVANRILARPWTARLLRRPMALLVGLAVSGTTAVHLLLHADAVVFRLFGYHLNGFVWNLLVTEGGIESLGASASTERSFALAALGYLLLQASLAMAALRVRWPRRCAGSRSVHHTIRPGRPRLAVIALVLLPLTSVLERLTFCISEQTGYRPVVAESGVFPFYMELHWRELGRVLGFSDARHQLTLGDTDDGDLAYPLVPLPPLPDAPRHNIVWLVAESLRADALDPEIMPETWAFAAGASRFVEHRSGGDGTRMGMFSMFYGLPGNYWFPFLAARRGPLLVELLQEAGYQFGLFTSARFSYPEFDRTLFAAVPGSALHERVPGLEGWENDRRNVGELLRFVDQCDSSHPFLAFMFFESPHARYFFPEESVIRRPYLDDFDYATLDEARDMPLVRNRYLNACHHLDGQLARVFDGLRQRGLVDSTLVVVTGDHGEEFMEHGRWGHNSAFTEQQIRVPLVIHAPGRSPEVVQRLTSHLDLPATLLGLLGLHADPAGWCLGQDVFGSGARSDCLVADWDDIGLLDAEAKIVLPMRQGDFADPRVTRADDEQPDPAEARRLLDARRPRLLELFAELQRFQR